MIIIIYYVPIINVFFCEGDLSAYIAVSAKLTPPYTTRECEPLTHLKGVDGFLRF